MEQTIVKACVLMCMCEESKCASVLVHVDWCMCARVWGGECVYMWARVVVHE
jgi:hypothetical protein